MWATSPSHHIFLHLIVVIIFGEENRSWSCSLCSFILTTIIWPLFGRDILLSTLFSNVFSLCSSLNVSYQVSHPYKTTSDNTQTPLQSTVDLKRGTYTLSLSLWYLFIYCTELRSQVLSIPGSYLEGPGFKYRLRNWLSWSRYFAVLLSPCGQMFGEYLKLGLTAYFHTLHWSSYYFAPYDLHSWKWQYKCV
jgi:hypothetical protein